MSALIHDTNAPRNPVPVGTAMRGASVRAAVRSGDHAYGFDALKPNDLVVLDRAPPCDAPESQRCESSAAYGGAYILPGATHGRVAQCGTASGDG